MNLQQACRKRIFRDLIRILRELIAKGNTVIVIEHDKSIILAADYLVQMGPKAGALGGYISYQGRVEAFLKEDDCHPFLKASSQAAPLKAGKTHITIRQLAKHTLEKELLAVPIGGITALTGKSGIGKTTLVKDIIIPSINLGQSVNCAAIDWPKSIVGAHYFEPKKLRTHANTLVVSYLDLLKHICKIFASESHLKPKDFSYKTKESQCPNCNGTGVVETHLDLTANTIETCDVCHGQRYQPDILVHEVQSKSIAEVLAMTLAELKVWFTIFKAFAGCLERIEALEDIGLGHLSLEQTVQSLSSRRKTTRLALELAARCPKKPTLSIRRT
ncbi:hypothetical protein N7U66_10075 [Lacinutrix neustonica]|uniref:UvrABC system protein A n=1 Tax=Lacinutrix neustonica TaxID=2980107 RepID=A0A9E8N173_9FLAO|nr:hypothetical protein [Lacinutrix neustonica]WAC03974.1 hypothetical protein N7U66_10075 [Lacinutrix neustonica]